MSQTSVVYGLYDPVSDELRYVGKTVGSLATRLRNHVNDALSKRKNTHAACWIRSLSAAPVARVLEVAPPSALNKAERRWIKTMKQRGASLTNLTDGGEGTLGRTHSPEAIQKIRDRAKTKSPEMRQRMREAQLGKTATPETRAKMSATRRGRKRPPELSLTLSIALRGLKKSPEHCQRLSESHRGQIVSAEHRQKISRALRGRPRPEAVRAKISKSKMGHSITDETREKMRQSQRRRFEREQCERTEGGQWAS